jgi:anti-anti-sigma factor
MDQERNMSTFAIADPSFHPLMLSSRLISELAQARSTLRATTERFDLAVIVSAGGELDASNDAVWRRLLSEAAAAAGPPGPLVVDISGLDFMGCCAYAALAEEAERCRNRGVEMRLVTNQPVVSRILKACGLGATLPVDLSVDAALSNCILVD